MIVQDFFESKKILFPLGPYFTILDHITPYWTILDNFGPCWTILDRNWQFHTHLNQLGLTWTNLYLFRLNSNTIFCLNIYFFPWLYRYIKIYIFFFLIHLFCGVFVYFGFHLFMFVCFGIPLSFLMFFVFFVLCLFGVNFF